MGHREVQQREEVSGHSQGTRSRLIQPHGLSPGSALHPWPQPDSEGIHSDSWRDGADPVAEPPAPTRSLLQRSEGP